MVDENKLVEEIQLRIRNEMCMCSYTYSSSHTHIHYKYTSTTLSCSILTLPHTLLQVTHGTLVGQPTRHVNSSQPELHRSSQRSKILRSDYSSRINNFDQSFSWLEPSRSVNISLSWITHQSARPLRHGSWNCVACMVFLWFLHVSCVLYPFRSFKNFVVFSTLSFFKQFIFCPWVFEILVFALKL